MFMPRLANLDHVVKERIRNFQKLVWHTGGDNDHVALDDLPRLPVANADASQLIRRRGFRVYRLAPGDESRGALQHVDDVCISGVDLRLSGLLTAAGMHHVIPAIAAVKQYRALGEGFV